MDVRKKKIPVPEFSEWKRSLKEYLEKELLPLALPDKSKNAEKYRKMMLSSAAMDIWVPAFTHSSFDSSSSSSNFEVYEFVGDKFLYYTFSIYARKKYPNFNQKDLNNINDNFTNKYPLAEISIKLGLLDHVRTIEALDTAKKKSDIFESVIGALTKIGDDLITPGIGYMIVFNFMTSVYNWYDNITRDVAASSVVNQVMQDYYGSLGWKDTKTKKMSFESWDKQTKTMKLYLNDIAVKMLTEWGRAPTNVEIYMGRDRAVLAEVTAASKKDAEIPLYQLALKNLQTIYKITPEFAKNYTVMTSLENMVRRKLIAKEDATEIFDKVNEKNKKNGILWNKVVSYDTNFGGKLYVLGGYRPDDSNMVVLNRIMFGKNDTRAADFKYYLFKQYADEGSLKDIYTYNKIEPERKK